MCPKLHILLMVTCNSGKESQYLTKYGGFLCGAVDKMQQSAAVSYSNEACGSLQCGLPLLFY